MEYSFDIYNIWRCAEKSDAEGCLDHGLFLRNLQRRGKMGVRPVSFERGVQEQQKSKETELANQLLVLNNTESKDLPREDNTPFRDPVQCDDRLRKSRVFLKRSCALGNPTACKFLNKPEYMKRAMELWGESCNRGNGFHCIELSRELVKQKDEKKAEEWRNKGLEILRGACDAKDAEACYIAAQEYYKNRNELQAYEDFTTACDLGEGPACFILGTRHKENTREYFEMIKRGCQSEVNGSLPACWRMGERMVQAAHSSTSNTEKNAKLIEATEYYQRACALGEFRACVYVQNMRRYGHPYGEQRSNKATDDEYN